MGTILVGYILGALCGASADAAVGWQRFTSSQVAMGTKVVIVLYAPDAATANRAFAAAFAQIAALDRMLSDYDSTSELMRLCGQSPTASPVPVSEELCEVLTFAQGLSRRTDGAFDVTVGPLTRLWRRARRRQEMPDPAQLAEAQKAVGYRYLVVNPSARTVELLRPEMRIDLGAIGQGYAADKALNVLREQGISSALVNVSGDVVTSDPPPGEEHWTVLIAPLGTETESGQPVHLRNAAVATSGDVWQFVEINGQRYSHVLDPRTGLGLTARCGVSVIAPNGMTADAFSTAVSVLGVERGLALIQESPGTAALIARLEAGNVVTHQTPNFAGYLPSDP